MLEIPSPFMTDSGKHPIGAARAPVVDDALSAAFHALPLAIVVASADGRLLVNPAARALLADAGVAGSDPTDVAALHRALRPRTVEGEPLSLESFPLQSALGGERVAAQPIVVSEGAKESVWILEASPMRKAEKTIGAVCTLRDTTDRVRDDQMADDLLGTAAHDLRTPLTALKACVQLVARGLDRLDAAARDRTLTLLVAQVDRLSSRIDDVLDASRIRRGRLEMQPIDLDVREELQKIVEEIGRTPHAPKIDLRFDAETLCAHCDPLRLRQIVRGILLDGQRGESPALLRAAPASTGGVEISVGAPHDSPHARTMRRLAHNVVTKLGGHSEDGPDGLIRLRLPPPTSAR